MKMILSISLNGYWEQMLILLINGNVSKLLYELEYTAKNEVEYRMLI